MRCRKPSNGRKLQLRIPVSTRAEQIVPVWNSNPKRRKVLPQLRHRLWRKCSDFPAVPAVGKAPVALLFGSTSKVILLSTCALALLFAWMFRYHCSRTRTETWFGSIGSPAKSRHWKETNSWSPRSPMKL